MKNLVVKGTHGHWSGKWVAGVIVRAGFMWVPCKDHDEAVRYATNMARWRYSRLESTDG